MHTYLITVTWPDAEPTLMTRLDADIEFCRAWAHGYWAYEDYQTITIEEMPT
jgi:hypothetical protein